MSGSFFFISARSLYYQTFAWGLNCHTSEVIIVLQIIVTDILGCNFILWVIFLHLDLGIFQTNRWVPWVFFLVLVTGAVVFLVVDSKDDPRRLQSLIGVVVLLLFGFVFSIAPKKVCISNSVGG